ncbi:MAG: hypothetical protein AB1757_03025 [Acidobacteriota bacterium]
MNRSKLIYALLILAITIQTISLTALAQNRGAKKPVANSSTGQDIKIRTQMTMQGHSSESLIYIKGARQRTEMGAGLGFVNLVQCDLKRAVQINDKAKTYLIQPFANNDTTTSTQPNEPQSPAPQQRKRGGIITHITTITDTGERKDFFGYTARHLKTSMTTESSPDACNQTKMKMETDGWYIDLNYGLDCQNNAAAAQANSYGNQGCQDQVRTRNIGSAKLGYPVDVTTTIYDASGRTTTMRTEVVELSRAALDAALFEIPEGYSEAKDYQQLMGINVGAIAKQAMHPSTKEAETQAPYKPSKPVDILPIATGPKKAGVIRVGVLMPKTQMGKSFEGVEAAEPIRNTVLKYLSRPAIEVTIIESRVASQIEVEAKQKACDYLLYTDVTQKQGGGGFGGFLKKASPLTGAISSVGYAGSTASAVATTVATAIVYTAADIAGNTKAKDEVTIEYKLVAANNTTTLNNTLKAKAKSDGEDVISPLIEQIAAAVLNVISKR